MTMDVSRLGIVVESTGIEEARKALIGGNGRGGLVLAADKAEKSVKKLTDTLKSLLVLPTGATAAAWNQQLGGLSTTLQQMSSSAMQSAKAMQQMVDSLNKLSTATNGANRSNSSFSSSGGVVTNTLKAMFTAATAYAAVNLGVSIVKQADSWALMGAKLQNATGSMHNAGVAQEQLFDLAQRLRVPLEDTVKLYTRLAPAVQRMGKDSGYAKDMVEGISTALQLSGATGGEAASVMLQLSQSFSSGVLNGAEFNAVAENGSVLMRALEKATGKSTYELKKMGSEGKLSMEVVGQAIQDALPGWRASFNLLPLTFEGAMQRLSNAWTKAVGEMGKSTGFNAQLSNALKTVEELIPSITQGLGDAFLAITGFIEQNREGLGKFAGQVVSLLKDVWDVAGEFGNWLAKITGASDGMGVMAKVLFGVRLAVAAIADAFSDVGMVVVQAGAFLFEHIVGRLVAARARTVEWTWQLGKLLETMSEGARALKFEDMADALGKAAVNSFQYTAATVKAVTQYNAALDTSNKLVDEMLTKRATEDTFVKRVWKSQNEGATKLATTIADLRKMENRTMNADDWNANPNPKTRTDEKGLKAAQTATEHYTQARDALLSKIEEQVVAQERLNRLGLDAEKMTEGERTAIKLETEMNTEKAKGAAADQLKISRFGQLIGLARELNEIELEYAHTKDMLNAEATAVSGQQTLVDSLRKEVEAAEAKAKAYGAVKVAVEEAELASAQARLADMDATTDGSRTAAMQQMIALMQQEVELRERNAAAANMTEQKKALEDLDKLMDPAKAKNFGDALADGFGRAGKAIGQLVNVFQKYEDRLGRNKKELIAIDKLQSGPEKTRAMERFNRQQLEDSLDTYAGMAGAAKTFFNEHSKGYKIMEAVEKTYRAFEVALAVQSFLEKSGLLAAFTGLFVTAKATETTAEVASVAPHVAAEGVKQGANAITALTSALAAPWPLNIAAFATVAAMLAALGVAVSGGGGVSSKDRQATQGTGTVLGDDDAKSESISKSIAILADNSDIALRYSSGMLSSLQNIEQSLTGATSAILRGGADVTGDNFSGGYQSDKLLNTVMFGVSGLLGSFIGGSLGKYLGFGSTKTLKDSGITFAGGQTVGSVLSGGVQGSAYQDVQTKKSAFGISYSNKTKRSTQALDADLENEFTNVISGMVDTVAAAAGPLGLSAESVKQSLSGISLALGDISLKGLTGDEIQKQLEAVFGAFGDKLVEAAFGPLLSDFQKAGEGLLETAVRVSSGIESASYELEKLGLTAINFTDIINKSGDVGAEIVRQSILLQEAGTGIGEIIGTMTGTASDLASTYKSLTEARGSLQALGIADDVTRDLIRAAGGLDALQDALDSYTDSFFSDSEKNAMNLSKLQGEFAKLNLSMPTSNAGFRSLVESLSSSGAEGQELAVKVMLLSEQFADLTSTTEELVSAARDDLTDAYERESQALTDTKEKFEAFATSLADFRKELIGGDLSTLNGTEKYMQAKAEYEDILKRAQAGDEDALSGFEAAAQKFLTSSREVYASSDTYTADFQNVLAATDMLAEFTAGKASVAEQQLDALNKQVEGLITLNESVLTVAQAIDNLLALTSGDGKQGILPVDDNRVYAMDYSAYGTGSSEALVEEIRSLSAEVKSLREGQIEQTGQIAAALYDSNEQSAQTIVEGTKEASLSSSYIDRVKGSLA